VTFPVFKAGDAFLRGTGGGFDFHTLPPYCTPHFAISWRKVSVLDDYGDENWELLPKEIKTCLTKISQQEEKTINWDPPRYWGRRKFSIDDAVRHSLPGKYKKIYQRLEDSFREHHERVKSKRGDETDFQNLTGVEFETLVGKLLRTAGYDVQGTSTTGDQGADLIAKKDGRTVIVQVKRYQGAVGNKAVQEVISALSFYGGDEGWVVTNSSFTPSSIALAQKANIKLFDGAFQRTRSLP